MNYTDLIQSTHIYKQLMHNENCHAYFVHSPDTEALKILSRLYACKFACTSYIKPCLVCDSCVNTLYGTQTDIYILDKDKVLTADINEIVSKLYVTPTQLKQKLYIIANLHTATIDAQNKLLKSLEEPPSVASFFLYASTTSTVLPTILSRCQVLQLLPFDISSLTKALSENNADQQKVSLAASASGGNLQNALDFLDNKDAQNLFALSIDTLLHLNTSKDIARISRPLIDKKQNLGKIIDYIQIILRDSLAYTLKNANFVLSKTNINDIISISKNYSGIAVLNILPKLITYKQQLSINANVTATVDALLLMLLEERYKCRQLSE